MGASIPFACQDWAATKAAHRFFSNPRVSEAAILAGHFEATTARTRASDGLIFTLHDTTAFSFQRKALEGVGAITRPRLNRGSGPRSLVCRQQRCGISRQARVVAELLIGALAQKSFAREGSTNPPPFGGRGARKNEVSPLCPGNADAQPLEGCRDLHRHAGFDHQTADFADGRNDVGGGGVELFAGS